MIKFQSDAVRRGLRTLIDVLLAGGSSGLILAILKVFGVDMTAEQFAALMATLTPVLSVIKNSLEDSSGKSFLVDKTRPNPDPVTETALPIVEGSDTTATDATTPAAIGTPGPLDNPQVEQVVFGEVPPGYILVAVAAEDVEDADDVVGVTR